MWLGGGLLLIPLETLMVLSHKGTPFMFQGAIQRQWDTASFLRVYQTRNNKERSGHRCHAVQGRCVVESIPQSTSEKCLPLRGEELSVSTEASLSLNSITKTSTVSLVQWML